MLHGFPENRANPEYLVDNYLVFAPQFKKFVGGENGSVLFNTYNTMANQVVPISIWNEEWELAMSWVISHYIALSNYDREQDFGLHEQTKSMNLKGNKIENIDYSQTTIDSPTAKFWNQTQYGQRFHTALKTKTVGLFALSIGG